MPDTHIAITASLEEDLLPLTALLRSRGLPHQVYEESGRQVLAVLRAQDVQPVQDLYRAWRAGEVRIELREHGPATFQNRLQWRSAPVTTAVALLCIALFLLLSLGGGNWLPWLTFLPFGMDQGRMVFGPMGAQYWRLVTPVLLHFGWLHIAFNMLWFWELGSRMERVSGSLNQLGILLVIAAVSNVVEFLVTGPAIFGGMSGVVYGLLGFSAVAPLIQPRWAIAPPKPVLLFLLGWLLVCLSGLVEALGFGAIANGAHVGGLLAGTLLGVLFAGLSRAQRPGA